MVGRPGAQQAAVVGHELLVLVGRERALDAGDQVVVELGALDPGFRSW
jgi:hypothetical protein